MIPFVILSVISIINIFNEIPIDFDFLKVIPIYAIYLAYMIAISADDSGSFDSK